jgi:UDP-N-acetyl-D-mannosaminuronic acid dehydrogenase
MKNDYDVCVIGGAGHVGAPAAILLADRGMRTLICDIDEETMNILSSWKMPFIEEGGEPMLRKVLAENILGFTSRIEDIENIHQIQRQ